MYKNVRIFMSMWMFDSFYDVWYVVLYNCVILDYFNLKRIYWNHVIQIRQKTCIYACEIFIKLYPGQRVCNDCVTLCFRLSEISPVVREALETPASVAYLNTLMEELGLQEQDLLNLVRMFKTQTHWQTWTCIINIHSREYQTGLNKCVNVWFPH